MHNNQSGNDENRLKAVKALLSPDVTRDEVLEKFVHLAAQVLGISGSFISIIDDKNQYIKVSRNFNLKESAREVSLCRHVIDGDGQLVVQDTLQDNRFTFHPLVEGEPHIRFYAGVSLSNLEGLVLGTLCVTDTKPHTFSDEQLDTLKSLAKLVSSFLDAWNLASFTDLITLLPNRPRLIRDMQQLAVNNPDRRFRLILIDCLDIPQAYELSRTFGIAPVENLLRQIAGLVGVRLQLQSDDMLYSFAPGRFALIQPYLGGYNAQSTVEVLTSLKADLADNITIDIDVYTGETEFVSRDIDANEVVRQAVSALHECIHQNMGAMTFDHAYDSRRTEDFLIMNDLAQALKKDEGLYLAYQPKVCLKTGKTVGLEALIRWHHPERGELFPADFIPLAIKTNLISVLTDWVIDRVIIQLKKWNNEFELIPVSVNVSERDFSRPEFASGLASKMQAAALPTALLGIECLENELITESDIAINGLEALKAQGFVISLDDFGTGYSNISYLQEIPLDVIKVDMSLIGRMDGDHASRIIVRSIIMMLKELNYTVLAEGVETEATLSLLKQYGCDQIQGYFFSKPLPASDIEHWLLQK
ncbi:sensor domain-containing phosphodiesterase [Pantoea ananatis]|uniref:sensor domain-containing phosphodiesterase n=1 Tax=Pantoea ananas TaxID=553 RepID=UPI000EEC16D3|nr:sensor domain-containing phosphodiesterase [Pantoea ananatis]HCP26598.1 sensor domain-containing phosphodiesterase [Pantoea ananatis]